MIFLFFSLVILFFVHTAKTNSDSDSYAIQINSNDFQIYTALIKENYFISFDWYLSNSMLKWILSTKISVFSYRNMSAKQFQINLCLDFAFFPKFIFHSRFGSIRELNLNNFILLNLKCYTLLQTIISIWCKHMLRSKWSSYKLVNIIFPPIKIA